MAVWDKWTLTSLPIVIVATASIPGGLYREEGGRVRERERKLRGRKKAKRKGSQKEEEREKRREREGEEESYGGWMGEASRKEWENEGGRKRVGARHMKGDKQSRTHIKSAGLGRLLSSAFTLMLGRNPLPDSESESKTDNKSKRRKQCTGALPK